MAIAKCPLVEHMESDDDIRATVEESAPSLDRPCSSSAEFVPAKTGCSQPHRPRDGFLETELRASVSELGLADQRKTIQVGTVFR
jgi:hypothetical protein